MSTTAARLTCELGNYTPPPPAGDGTPWDEWLAESRRHIALVVEEGSDWSKRPAHPHDVMPTMSTRTTTTTSDPTVTITRRLGDTDRLTSFTVRRFTIDRDDIVRPTMTDYRSALDVVPSVVGPQHRATASPTRVVWHVATEVEAPTDTTPGEYVIGVGGLTERESYMEAFKSWRPDIDPDDDSDVGLTPRWRSRQSTESYKAEMATLGAENGIGQAATAQDPHRATALMIVGELLDTLQALNVRPGSIGAAILDATPESRIGRLRAALDELQTLDQLARHMSVRRITKRDATADVTDATGMLSIAHNERTSHLPAGHLHDPSLSLHDVHGPAFPHLAGDRWLIGSRADDGQTTITSPAVIAKTAAAFVRARNVPSGWTVPVPPVPTSKVSPSKRTSGIYVARRDSAVADVLESLKLWHEWTGQALTFSRAMRSERPNGGRPPAWAKAAIQQARTLGVPIDMGN